MSAPPETAVVVRQWIEKADNDLRAAEYILTLRENCPFDAACFHAQQCAEKCLKALLVSRQIDFGKTHDLRLLIQLIPSGLQLNLDLKSLISLNRYAVESRYPGDYEPITREEAERATAAAKDLRDALRKAINV